MFNRIRQHFTKFWRTHVQLTPQTDLFFILNFFLATAGVYLPLKNGFIKLCWKVYRVFMILHFAMILRRLLLTLTTERTFDPLVNGIHVALGVTILLSRSMLIQANFKHFKTVRKYLNERSFHADDPEAVRIRQQSYEMSVKVTIIFIANILFQSISITSSGMTDMDPFQIPFGMEDFSDFERSLFTGLYSLLWAVYSYVAASNFLTIYLGLVGLRAEMRIAVDSFGKVMDRVEVRLEQKPGEQNFWKFLQDELNTCIEHHSEVLNQLKVFKNLTNLSFLLLYYMTMLFIALGVIIVFFRATLDIFTVTAIDYTLRYLIECYVFCHMVSSFNEEHSKIGPTLSHQPWISQLRCRKEFASQFRQVRATILIVTMQSQRSLNISCGELFELTMAKFTGLVNRSYSVMMFVWNAKQGHGVAW
ncbi:uncharacterized protein LOC120417733 [Culex pipiens pallens]|uniref:uncharacterized protein LOC120417733 n=1 Tax=Culex pipiens pallens TaxID=42434 RepID=UPI00195365B6|nr:uncharacterized protein LOC120417733 [Culex pipiens pallens]